MVHFYYKTKYYYYSISRIFLFICNKSNKKINRIYIFCTFTKDCWCDILFTVHLLKKKKKFATDLRLVRSKNNLEIQRYFNDKKIIKYLSTKALKRFKVTWNTLARCRLGRGGRTFKSCHPDHLKDSARGLFLWHDFNSVLLAQPAWIVAPISIF